MWVDGYADVPELDTLMPIGGDLLLLRVPAADPFVMDAVVGVE